MYKTLQQILARSFLYHATLTAWLFLTAPSRYWRRLSYRKPVDWSSRTFSQKLKWRNKHPDPGTDYELWVDKHRAKQEMSRDFNVPRTYRYIRNIKDLSGSGLPGAYVMKAAHGWSMNLFVRDGLIVQRMPGGSRHGQRADSNILRKTAREWLKSPRLGRLKIREHQYLYPKPGILIEQFLDVDYRLEFFLFGGVSKIAMVHIPKSGHLVDEPTRFRLYDPDWELLDPGNHSTARYYDSSEKQIPAPDPELLKRLEQRFRDFDHVRVDFLVCAGEAYFNEVTFTHSAGRPSLLGQYEDDLGKYWV